MNDFFETEDYDKVLLHLLPEGKIFKKAWEEGSRFNSFIKFLAACHKRRVEIRNDFFKAKYPCGAGFLLDQWCIDYSLPNGIFYYNREENIKDIFVLKFLMKGNRAWNFRAIANIYNVDIKIHLDVDVAEGMRYPAVFPQGFSDGKEVVGNDIIISVTADEERGFVYDFPIPLGHGRILGKLKQIYNIIKPVQCSIKYRDLTANEKLEPKMEFCVD